MLKILFGSGRIEESRRTSRETLAATLDNAFGLTQGEWLVIIEAIRARLNERPVKAQIGELTVIFPRFD